MIKIYNEEACAKAIKHVWREWHSNIDDNEMIPAINISFEKGFRYAWMIVELKEAELDLEQCFNDDVNLPLNASAIIAKSMMV